MAREFSREDEVPRAGPKMWIERIGAGGEGLFTIFSRKIYGVWTHWNLYGSSPCYADRERCPGCTNRAPRRWKGYLHAYDHHNKRQCFLEITPVSAESIKQQIGDGVQIRGFRLKVKRGNGPKARVKVEVQQALVGGPPLVDERSPEETLRKLWEIPGPGDDARQQEV